MEWQRVNSYMGENMLKTIELPNNRFETIEFSDLRRKNFIFGKNGTGKSTLTSLIVEKYGENHKIDVFNGFDKIVSEGDSALEAITLGKKNVDLWKKIEKKQQTLIEMQKRISDDNVHVGDLLKNKRCTEKAEISARKKYEDKLTDKATNIAEILNLGRKFNKRNLKEYIKNSNDKLSEEDEKIQFDTFKSSSMVWKTTGLPDFDFQRIINELNEIRGTSLIRENIESYLNDFETENWVKSGLKLYKNEGKNDLEICAFCGQHLPAKRLNQLEQYFNNGILAMDEKITKLSKDLQQESQKIDYLIEIDPISVYPEFRSKANEYNELLKSTVKQCKGMIKFLTNTLQEKERQKASSLPSVELDIPDFIVLNRKFNEIKTAFEEYSKNLIKNKKTAQDKLKASFSHEANTDPEVVEAKTLLIESQNKKVEAINTIKSVESEIQNLQTNINELMADATDEKVAAETINKVLEGLGNTAFFLHYLASEKTNMPGQYQIQGTDGCVRPIDTLSTGEENLIAFLWFIYKVKSESNKYSDRIVIFDDPMTSNDDATQYLMIAEINKLLAFFGENSPETQFFIFTHNTHFYMQLKPVHPKEKKEALFRFHKSNGRTVISNVTKGKGDVSTIYETLWEDLIFAKNSGKTTFMWNTMRRILETYNRFMFSEDSPQTLENHLNNLDEQVIYAALLKSLHVNSHVGYETDVDLSDYTVIQLWTAFENIFEMLGEVAHTHFSKYSNEAEKKFEQFRTEA